MLPKSQRLNLKTNFRWVASGQSYTSKNFKLFYRLGENNEPKIGVSIATSEFKKATARNKAKRICFDMAKKYYQQLHKGINLVIMPKAQVMDLNETELDKEFKYAFSNLKIN
ncbi:ribonuclease P protein component [Candidatus Daviesbacteria bacterium]|nr:ribonuclease P protein component [Candidatus Daviesbacteria bacterium]